MKLVDANFASIGIFESKLESDLYQNMRTKFPEIQSFEDMDAKYEKMKSTPIGPLKRTNFDILKSIIRFVKTLPIEVLQDDLDYTFPKFSIIPAGTIFYRRHKENSFIHGDRKIWLDYSGTVSSKHLSFLKNTNASHTKEYVNVAKAEFGPYLMKFRVNKDLLIFHYPSYATSFTEGWARYQCYAHYGFCANDIDGYTLDFLKFNPNEGYRNLPILEGFRELCIYDNRNVELIETIHDP